MSIAQGINLENNQPNNPPSASTMKISVTGGSIMTNCPTKSRVSVNDSTSSLIPSANTKYDTHVRRMLVEDTEAKICKGAGVAISRKSLPSTKLRKHATGQGSYIEHLKHTVCIAVYG